MICAFDKLSELEGFLSQLTVNDAFVNASLPIKASLRASNVSSISKQIGDKYEVHESEDIDFFYAVISPKVSASEDERTLEDLFSKFPSVDTKAVESIWNEHHTWGAVFDILSSLVSSHGKVALRDISLNLSSPESWPPLPSTQHATQSSSTSTASSSTATSPSKRGKGQKWTLLSIRDMSISDDCSGNERAGDCGGGDGDGEAMDEDIGRGGSDDSYENIDDDDILEEELNSSTDDVEQHKPLEIIPTKAGGRSYIDVLLIPKNDEEERRKKEELEAKKALARGARTEWKPVFNVKPVPHVRIDRLYGAQATTQTLDDEDDDGMWDLVEGQLSMGNARGAVRMRNSTMMTAKQAETKANRIALKGK